MSRGYLLRKIGKALAMILAVVLLNFILFRLLPGDPVRSLVPRNLPPEARAAMRERLGLDRPLVPGVVWKEGGWTFRIDAIGDGLVDNQLVRYIGSLVALELGGSFFERRPVSEVILERTGPTLLLVLTAETLALVLGTLIGIRAGWRRGSTFDTLAINASLVLYGVPLFWLAMLMLYFFATQGGIVLFPSQQMITPGVVHASALDAALDVGSHMVLPVATLTLGLLAAYAVVMRSSIVEVLGEDYITTARAKGLRDKDVLRHHALPNALLPTVTIAALTFGGVIGGAIGVEQVFNWPGMGTLIVRSVTQKDFPVLQGVFLFITIGVIIGNLVADILHGVLDPRVRR